MRTSRISRALGLIAAAGLVVAAAACKQDQLLAGNEPAPATLPSFTIKDLGLLPGGGAESEANSATSALVVGWATDGADAPRAVTFAAGKAVPLAEPAGADSSEAQGAGASGMIAGFAMVSGVSQALLWTSAAATPVVLPTLGGVNAFARAVNVGGIVHGWSETAAGDTVPVIWGKDGNVSKVDSALTMGDPTWINDSNMVAGNTPGGGYFWMPGRGLISIQSFAGDFDVNGLNNTGVVVGRVLTDDSLERAFRWTAARGMIRLGEPPAGYASIAGADVNDNFLVAATASNSDASGNTTGSIVAVSTALEPFRQFTALPTLGGARASASDGGISKCGVIVGWAFQSGSAARHAVAWVPAGCSVP